MSDFYVSSTREVIKAWQAIRAAEEHVAPHVGPITDQSSEFGVYKAALKKLGMDTAGLCGSAAAAKVVFTANTTRGVRPRPIALDAKATTARLERFPQANRLARV